MLAVLYNTYGDIFFLSGCRVRCQRFVDALKHISPRAEKLPERTLMSIDIAACMLSVNVEELRREEMNKNDIVLRVYLGTRHGKAA